MSTRRLPAEWEPQSAIQFTFPHPDSDWADSLSYVTPTFVELITTVSEYQPVLVVCQDRDAVGRLLPDADPRHLLLVEAPSDDTWARDHGGITVEEDGSWVVLDFMFNGWGLKFPARRDNLITERLHGMGVFGDTPRRIPGLVLEGGALETDGQGTLLTTVECLLSPNRNPHLDRSALEAALTHWLGVDRFLWLHHGYLAGDDTDSHVDTLARFIDPQTIAYVACDDPADEHYAALQQMKQELEAFRTRDGQPYRLVPLPLPRACHAKDGRRLPATYANFLIINEAVLVPTYRVPEDGVAIKQLQECFPDRTIETIDCRPLIEQHGSLHCATMQYPAGVVLTR
jgi:agmatine deiminase